jgi:hypothetical protein
VAIGFMVAASGARAQVSQAIATYSAGSYAFAPGTMNPPGFSGQDTFAFHQTGTTPGQADLVNLELNSTVQSNGSFDFLQNLYCIGACAVSLDTFMNITITNNTASPVNLRFDSQITPGHLAIQGNDPQGGAHFLFSVIQQTDGVSTDLYNAAGDTEFGEAPKVVSSAPFNGATFYQNGSQMALDWSATNLDLPLTTIPAFDTSVVTYEAFASASNGAVCNGLGGCDGAQIAFGDPRNNGGVTPPSQGASLFERATAAAGTALSPLIGLEFDPYLTGGQVVPLDTPLPPTPPVDPPITYAAVPEPSAWAMLILGVAGLGAVLRRRNVARAARSEPKLGHPGARRAGAV